LGDVANEDKQFNLDFEGGVAPLVFTADMCGGIPAYVHAWDEVNAIWDAIANSEGDIAEAQATLAGRLEELMRMLFVQDQDDNVRLEITRCRRIQRISKSK
jgi:hypothetical protein